MIMLNAVYTTSQHNGPQGIRIQWRDSRQKSMSGIYFVSTFWEFYDWSYKIAECYEIVRSYEQSFQK